jgi:signal peptidase II
MKKILILIFLIALDQLIKYFSQQNLLPDFGGVFIFACNPVLSWGIPLQGFFFWFFWLIAFSGLLYLTKKFNFNIFLIFVLAGAISNFIDRVLHGCVIDYIKLLSFPVFNLADIYITLGIIAFLLFTFFKKPQSPTF